MGPSMASIPFCLSQYAAVSINKNAAFWLLMHSKKPIPPVGCGFLNALSVLINAAILPITLLLLSFKIQRVQLPC